MPIYHQLQDRVLPPYRVIEGFAARRYDTPPDSDYPFHAQLSKSSKQGILRPRLSTPLPFIPPISLPNPHHHVPRPHSKHLLSPPKRLPRPPRPNLHPRHKVPPKTHAGPPKQRLPQHRRPRRLITSPSALSPLAPFLKRPLCANRTSHEPEHLLATVMAGVEVLELGARD